MAKVAAVLIGLLDENIILTKRADNLRSFASHICLPGGSVDLEDKGIVEAAIREFNEEVNFIGTITPILCMLPEISPVSKHAVFPVVAKLTGNIQGFNLSEVSKLIYLPFNKLAVTDFKINQQLPHIIHNYCFNCDNELIWGLTAHILRDFSINIKPNILMGKI